MDGEDINTNSSLRTSKIERLGQQIISNLNLPSIIDILKRRKFRDVARTVGQGIGLIEEEALGNEIYYRGERIGTYDYWNVVTLVPRVSLSDHTHNIAPYRIASEVFAKIGMHYGQSANNIIAGTTASGYLWLNNGIEVRNTSGYDERCRIDGHKGGLFITPQGNMGIFLPRELDSLYRDGVPDTVFVGASLSFEVPDINVDRKEMVEYADYIISSQAYLESYAGCRGFISITPDGQIGYTVFRGNQTGMGVFPRNKNTGESVLAMTQIFPVGTRLCALEEGMTARPFYKGIIDLEEYLPLYFYAVMR